MTGPETNYAPPGGLPSTSLTTPSGQSRGKISFTGTMTDASEDNPSAANPSIQTTHIGSSATPKSQTSKQRKSPPTPQTESSPITSNPKSRSRTMAKSPCAQTPAKCSKVLSEDSTLVSVTENN
ncbi:hypothetical protein DFH28DRAFT_937783 [Melampsora americana]|nr:hypothetical protein DFH28DRAFT_937783 [Melampsora americana]